MAMVIASIFMSILSIACDCCLFYMTVDIQIHGKVEHGPQELDEINDACKKYLFNI
jgi:hypothetical protein